MASVGRLVLTFCVNHLRKPSLQLPSMAMHTNPGQIQSFAMKNNITMNIIGLNLSRKTTKLKDNGSINLNLTSRLPRVVTIAPPAYSIPTIGYDDRNKGMSDRILPTSFLIVEKTDPSVSIGKERREIPTMEDPSVSPLLEKRAARLIVIRRRKMKKHKLRKFRKRMYHVIARIKQRRAAQKEKVFQDELLAQMSRADEFDAEAWVNEFLQKATTDPQTLIPKKPKPVKPTRYVLD